MAQIARDLGVTSEALRIWVKQADIDEGLRHDGLTTEETEEVRRLRREIKTLREEREILYDPGSPIEDQIQDVAVVVDHGGSVGTREMLDTACAAGVRLWQVLGTGVDHVDVPSFLERGMPLANTPGLFSAIALAEHALFMMLYFAKNVPQGQQNIRSGIFWQPVNEELSGKTLGLVGLGAGGRELATRAVAMGMRILAIDVADVSTSVLKACHVSFFGKPEKLDHLLADSDYLSLHVPLTAATRHLIDAPALQRMKASAVLINVARGEIADEDALIQALRDHTIRGAGLDTFAYEPLRADHPFFSLDNVLMSPHVAGVTTGTSWRRAQAAAENVCRVAEGRAPLYLITGVE
jgi:D-3-phosphoglycerate dehydrogenase